MSKKSTVLFNIVLLSSLGLSVSCNNSGKTQNSQISTMRASQLVSEGKTQDASEMYARIGEILLTKPEGIIHAQTMFQKALDINKSNDKANLYSSILAPVLTAKGFVTRFKNVTELNNNKTINTDSFEKDVRGSGIPEFIDFALQMPEGATAAKNADDVRKFVRNEYVKELGNSIQKLQNIKSDVFTLNLELSAYSGKNKSVTYCTIQNGEVLDCQEQYSAIKNANITVDSYDVKALKMYLRTQKNALLVATSFGLEGSKYVADILKNKTSHTDKEVVEALKTQPNFLRIAGTKEDLREIFDNTEEILNDMIDFSKISKTVCKSQERTSNLFNDVCVSERSAETMSEALLFVAGPKSVTLGHDINGREVSVEVNLKGLMDSNVSSLQELLPVKFDYKGRATDIKDLTFAGIIPNADLIEKLKTVVAR